jgi:succinate dehydrogenase / fumarate reductase cytochrome b subunit
MGERSDSNARPLSPRLSIYRWSLGMLASVAHRASGVVLVLFVPLYLWLLHGMTGSAESFSAVFDWLHSGIGRFSLWLAGTALIYHFCNGIRFLLVDIGAAESRRALRVSAAAVIAVAALASLLLAVLL